MIKKSLLLGAIASIIAINSVLADTTVTSKTYVDNQDDALYNELDEIKQDIVPVAGTNASTPGSAVVTYTGTAGQIGERGILEPGQLLDMQTDANKLVTVGQVSYALGQVSEQIEQATHLPRTTTTNKVCTEWVSGQSHTDANCLLWNLVDQTVYGCLADGASCTSPGQCCGGYCDGGVCESLEN
jgi:hypothetical protein